MPVNQNAVIAQYSQAVENWFAEFGDSRNSCVAALKILDSLLEADCPIDPASVTSRRGGELAGVRGPGLTELLKKYGECREFTKGATARQTLPNALRLLADLQSGNPLAGMAKDAKRKVLAPSFQIVLARISHWFLRQNIKVPFPAGASPSSWVEAILQEAQTRTGPVAQHLVGAKLQKRFPNVSVQNHPSTAGDQQTGRKGDFEINRTVFHVTMTPGYDVIKKCAANIDSGLVPVLLVPRNQTEGARALAKAEGIQSKLTVLAIEEFVATNVLELSDCDADKFRQTLEAILAEYNKRVDEVEVDKSLRIESK